MYHPASGYQQYYTHPNHDENAHQPYGPAAYQRWAYPAPPDAPHPQTLTQDTSYYPPPEQYAHHVLPPQMAPGMGMDHASARALPSQAFPVDPAFSSDPRANLNNPYTHYTAYRMDSREEIVPAGVSHDSFYNESQQHEAYYHSRDPRVVPAGSHKHRRDISSIYGPPLANPSNSRPLSDASQYSNPSYAAPSVHDPHVSAASLGSVQLPYDVPETQPAVIPMPPPMNNPSSSSSKLHKKHHTAAHQEQRDRSSSSLYVASAAASSFSSSSSSFVHVHTPHEKSSTSLPSVARSRSRSSLYIANPSPDVRPTTPLKPAPDSPNSSFSSQSSASSPEEPITPPQTASEKSHASTKLSKKHSRSPKRKPDLLQLDTERVNDIINVAATEDFPPAYTPLPTQTETITASSPAVDTKPGVSVVLSPEGITFSSSMGNTAVPGPSRERARENIPSNEASGSGILAMPEPQFPTLDYTPPRDAAAPDLASSTSQASASAAPSGSQPTIQAPSEVKKSRSRKPSIAAAPKDLDKIDELDETDPLGFAWHHDSPYEAILRAVKNPGQQDSSPSQESGGPKIFQAANGTDARGEHGHAKKSRRKPPPPLDPSITSFKVKPGEIFPPILAPQQMPPGVIPAPMTPQAPMSPVQRQAFTNAHLRPVGKYEPVPPPFSPTPSQMERATNPAHRMSMMSQMTAAEPSRMYFNAQQPMPPSLASAHSHSHSQAPSQKSQHSNSSSSVPSSSHGSSSRSSHRVLPPQEPANYDEFARRPRPQPQSVQPSQSQQRPQSTISRSNTTPNPRTVPLPGATAQYQKPTSAPHVLSADPPPKPDIPLPPPSTYTRSIAPPSINSQMSSRPPQPHYLPKKLVMPTPLQPLQPLPHQHHLQQQQQQQIPSGVPMSSASSSFPHRGRGEHASARTGAGLKRGVTVGAIPMAQEIPMSAGRNLLKKHKDTKVKDKELERDIRELERRERDQSYEKEREVEREKVREQGKEERDRVRDMERERQRGKGRSASVSVPPGTTAMFTSQVVVPVQPTKSSGGGWGFHLFGLGDKEKAREREREKERERAEREMEKEHKKLSKRR